MAVPEEDARVDPALQVDDDGGLDAGDYDEWEYEYQDSEVYSII